LISIPPLTPRKASLHGMLCADGTVHCGLYRKLHPKWTYLLQLAEPNSSLRKLFAKYVWLEYKVIARDKPAEGLIKAYGKAMAVDITRYGHFGRRKWTVPIAWLNRTTAAYWLRSYFDGDGDIHNSGDSSRCRVRAKSINKTGLMGVNSLLWQHFGIQGRLYKHGEPKGNWSQAYEIEIFNRQNILRYACQIGFNHPDKSRKLASVVRLLDQTTSF
jgi:hypothetical protein